MLTGTPLDLTPFGSVLTGIGVIYWLLALGALIVAIKVPKSRWRKLVAALVVLCLFGYLPASGIVSSYLAQRTLTEANAHFEMLCKNAGERIVRTVENVEGVVWMKWREPGFNRDDQYKLDDPHGKDCEGEGCIAQLLRITTGAALNPEEAQSHRAGYRFVESTDPRDGKVYRYVGVIELPASWTAEKIEEHRKATGAEVPSFSYRFQVKRVPIPAYSATYGVTWDDISSPEDRKRWIAGGSTKVIDLTSKAVVAERIGYMLDRGLGSTVGGRQPWGFAPDTACPAFRRSPDGVSAFRSYRSRDFINRVLGPTTGDQ